MVYVLARMCLCIVDPGRVDSMLLLLSLLLLRLLLKGVTLRVVRLYDCRRVKIH